METANLISSIMTSFAPINPEVGMGATLVLWTDRQAGTIVEVSKSGKKLKWKRDKTIPLHKGMTDAQEYAYTEDPDALEITFSLRKNGRWIQVGCSPLGNALIIGSRMEYYDHSF